MTANTRGGSSTVRTADPPPSHPVPPPLLGAQFVKAAPVASMVSPAMADTRRLRGPVPAERGLALMVAAPCSLAQLSESNSRGSRRPAHSADQPPARRDAPRA